MVVRKRRILVDAKVNQVLAVVGYPYEVSLLLKLWKKRFKNEGVWYFYYIFSLKWKSFSFILWQSQPFLAFNYSFDINKSDKFSKGVVAISFLFLVKSVLAIPGGYTAANDIVKVQLVESEWAEARRAGELKDFYNQIPLKWK